MTKMKETEGISVDKFVDYAIMCMQDFTITKHFILLPAPGAGIHIFGLFPPFFRAFRSGAVGCGGFHWK